MTWLNMPQELCQQLLELCDNHAPELSEKLVRLNKAFHVDPKHPWQNREAAVKILRDKYQFQGSDVAIEIDEDAAISQAGNGLWVQGWLWVGKEDLEDAFLESVQES